jgi:hypothetical protein
VSIEDLPKEAIQTTKKLSILLVENNADVRAYIKIILQGEFGQCKLVLAKFSLHSTKNN